MRRDGRSFRGAYRAVPLVLLALAACPKDKDDSVVVRPVLVEVEIPEAWQSREAAVVMRLTNASSTSTEVKRALNELFNDADDPTDPMDFLMRSPERDPATGELLPVDTSLSTAELMAGSSLEQAQAYRAKVLNGDGVPFSRDEARDACGNEMLMTMMPTGALQAAFPEGPQGLPVWPVSCPNGADCPTSDWGSWDVGLGEMRFDGLIDMVVNVFPDTRVTPIQPGIWGHVTGFFLTTNNPGFGAVPLFANVRRAQINLLGVWELDRNYVDPVGVREVFKFPHRTRELDSADVFVFLEGNRTGPEYWQSTGLSQDAGLPFGLDMASPVTMDLSAPAGADIFALAGPDEALLRTLEDVVTYQIGAAIACPSVREARYVKSGPVEFFACPDVDIGTCLAREDMEEGACTWQEEPTPSPFDPLAQPITFERHLVASPTQPVPFPESRLPAYLASPAPGVQVRVQLDVNPDSVLYLLAPDRIVAAETQTGLPVTLPAPIADTHCTDDPVQRFNLGEAWQAGTYLLTVDLTADPDGTPGSGDELESETGVGGTNYLVWMYFTSIAAWSTGG